MKPLDGIRVVDLTNVLSGPFCGYQLALLGADVVKVEPPHEGDLARQLGADPALNAAKMGTSFLAQNAGKRSITLDLKNPRGKEAFKKLCATADVVIENFRPGVMQRLELDYPVLSALNPRLVYCAVSGFGQTGSLRNNPAYDQIIQGLSGLMSVTGDSDSGPLRAGFPVCDTIGGLTAAFAISAALVQAKTSGKGAELDVSMLESTLATMGWVVSNYLIAGVTPQPMGNENFTAAPSGTFRTQQGLLNIAANKQEQFVKLCELIERADLVSDPRFNERESRKKNRFALRAEIENSLIKKPATEWEHLLNRNGVPSGRVLSLPETLQQGVLEEREFLYRFERIPGAERDIKLMRPGFRVDGASLTVDTPPPRLGEHTQEVLRELGYSDLEVAQLQNEAAV